MSTEDNKALVRRVFDMVNQRKLEQADEVFARDYVYTAPGMPELRGPDGFKQLVMGYVNAFPDLQMTMTDIVAEGDRVATSWSGSGTHRGELMGIAPTGKRISVIGMVMSRCAGGKIVQDLEVFDTLGMLQQLGAVPAPAESSANR